MGLSSFSKITPLHTHVCVCLDLWKSQTTASAGYTLDTVLFLKTKGILDANMEKQEPLTYAIQNLAGATYD